MSVTDRKPTISRTKFHWVIEETTGDLWRPLATSGVYSTLSDVQGRRISAGHCGKTIELFWPGGGRGFTAWIHMWEWMMNL